MPKHSKHGGRSIRIKRTIPAPVKPEMIMTPQYPVSGEGFWSTITSPFRTAVSGLAQVGKFITQKGTKPFVNKYGSKIVDTAISQGLKKLGGSRTKQYIGSGVTKNLPGRVHFFQPLEPSGKTKFIEKLR